MRRMVQRAGIVAAVAAAIGACGGGGPTTNTPVVRIAKTATASGDGQTATVGTVLLQDIRVVVTQDGAPKSGVSIIWTARSGGATPATSVTNDSGIAITSWKLGTVSGEDSLFAALSLALGSPQLWLATGQAGAPKHLAMGNGGGQVAAINTDFPQALTAALSDSFGNPVPGVSVTWAILSGDASVSEPGAATDANGISSQTITAGATTGPVAIQATNASLPGVFANFGLTVAAVIKVVNASGAGSSAAFTSASNSTFHPAVDTIPVHGAIRWVNATGSHTVLSTGNPSFISSGTLTASGYTAEFPTAGTYTYECGIHGPSMNGRVVVQ